MLRDLQGIVSGVEGRASSPVQQTAAPVKKTSTWVPLTLSREPAAKESGEKPTPAVSGVHTVLRPDAKPFSPLPFAELEGSQLDISLCIAEENGYPARASAKHKPIAYDG